MIYLLIIVLQVLLIYHFDILQRKQNKWGWYLFVEIVLILVAGLRYRLGVDSIRYESYFEYLPKLWEIDYSDLYGYSYDPMYLFMASAVRSVTDKFWVLQLVQSTLVNTIVFWFIRRNTHKPFIAVFLYSIFLYSNFMCEVMREACAVAMSLVAWEYLKENKYIKSTVFCVLGALFHTSGIILLLYPLAQKLKIWRSFRVNFKGIVVVVGAFVIMTYIQSEFFTYLRFLENIGSVGMKIDRYVNTDLAVGVLNIFGVLSTLIPQAIVPGICVYLLKQRDEKKVLDIEPMVFMCMLCGAVSIPIALFYRYNNYFMLFAIVAISRIAFDNRVLVHKLVIKNVNMLWGCLILGMCYIQYRGLNNEIGTTYLKEYMRYYPYSTVLNPQRDKNREAVFNYYDAY